MYICYRYSFYKKDHCFFNNYCQHVFEKTDGVCKYVFSPPSMSERLKTIKLHGVQKQLNFTMSERLKAIKLHDL